MALSTQAFASVKTELAAVDAKLKACTTKDDSTVSLKMCTSDAYDAGNKVLNTLYGSIVAGLKATDADEAADDKETLGRLIASERAWIGYRDADCRLEGTEMLGGSGETLVIDTCLFTMTKQRATALDGLLNTK